MTCVPVKASEISLKKKREYIFYILINICFKTCLSGVILETVRFRSHEVATLVLSDSDVPGPSGGGGGGVDVDGDGHAGGAGGHPHVLPSVVATDDWRGREPWHTD